MSHNMKHCCRCLFTLLIIAATINVALAAPLKVRVGISTEKDTLQLWSNSKLLITDSTQPYRKMLIAPRSKVEFTKDVTPQQMKAYGTVLTGVVTISVDGKKFPAWQVVAVRPLDWHEFIRVSSNGESAQWARPYRGTFEITPQTYSFDPARHQNSLRVVNIVSMEDYLKGVVPWEMTSTAPLEALKAQAICARSETIHDMQGGRHRDDGFDMCDYDHCQGYPGTENENARSNAAVEQTAGYVLTYNGAIADAVYGTNSGGITADSTDVWRGPEVPYLRNVFDFASDSSITKIVKPNMTEADWAVYCTTNLPSFAQPTQADIDALAARRAKSSRVAALYQPGDLPDFYRWSRTITQPEILQALAPKMHPPVNIISELLILKRAASGHIKELQVVGKWQEDGDVKSTSTLLIKGDGAIRSMLSGRLGSIVSLPSSTFVVSQQGDASGFPNAFVLKGAGWGHGVGMCQDGAAAHAKAGWSARQILLWYFQGVKITK
ncbi:MAG: SpoIID/LytB domain-containing protein [Abditibacteriaceae bacterium]